MANEGRTEGRKDMQRQFSLFDGGKETPNQLPLGPQYLAGWP
jgi:hypothetical protein